MEENPPTTQLFAFEPRARRFELLVRIVYSIAIGLVMWVYGLVAGICLVLQWLLILVFGRRNESLSEFFRGYLEYHVHVLSYTSAMTDRRRSCPARWRSTREKSPDLCVFRRWTGRSRLGHFIMLKRDVHLIPCI